MEQGTVSQLKCNHCQKEAAILIVGYCESCNRLPRCERCKRIREEANSRFCERCQFDIDKTINPKLEFTSWKEAKMRRKAVDEMLSDLTPEEIANLRSIAKKKK